MAGPKAEKKMCRALRNAQLDISFLASGIESGLTSSSSNPRGNRKAVAVIGPGARRQMSALLLYADLEPPTPNRRRERGGKGAGVAPKAAPNATTTTTNETVDCPDTDATVTVTIRFSARNVKSREARACASASTSAAAAAASTCACAAEHGTDVADCGISDCGGSGEVKNGGSLPVSQAKQPQPQPQHKPNSQDALGTVVAAPSYRGQVLNGRRAMLSLSPAGDVLSSGAPHNMEALLSRRASSAEGPEGRFACNARDLITQESCKKWLL